MVCIARDASGTPQVRKAVYDLLRGLGAGNDVYPTSYRRLASMVWNWVHSNVEFIEDEYLLAEALGIPYDQLDKELLISPQALLSMPRPMGDCDDFSMLCAAMLLNLGFPKVQYVTIAADEWAKDDFSHVYNQVWLPDSQSYMILDCSHGDYPGWETKNIIYRKVVWDIN